MDYAEGLHLQRPKMAFPGAEREFPGKESFRRAREWEWKRGGTLPMDPGPYHPTYADIGRESDRDRGPGPERSRYYWANSMPMSQHPEEPWMWRNRMDFGNYPPPHPFQPHVVRLPRRYRNDSAYNRYDDRSCSLSYDEWVKMQDEEEPEDYSEDSLQTSPTLRSKAELHHKSWEASRQKPPERKTRSRSQNSENEEIRSNIGLPRRSRSRSPVSTPRKRSRVGSKRRNEPDYEQLLYEIFQDMWRKYGTKNRHTFLNKVQRTLSFFVPVKLERTEVPKKAQQVAKTGKASKAVAATAPAVAEDNIETYTRPRTRSTSRSSTQAPTGAPTATKSSSSNNIPNTRKASKRSASAGSVNETNKNTPSANTRKVYVDLRKMGVTKRLPSPEPGYRRASKPTRRRSVSMPARSTKAVKGVLKTADTPQKPKAHRVAFASSTKQVDGPGTRPRRSTASFQSRIDMTMTSMKNTSEDEPQKKKTKTASSSSGSSGEQVRDSSMEECPVAINVANLELEESDEEYAMTSRNGEASFISLRNLEALADSDNESIMSEMLSNISCDGDADDNADRVTERVNFQLQDERVAICDLLEEGLTDILQLPVPKSGAKSQRCENLPESSVVNEN